MADRKRSEFYECPRTWDRETDAVVVGSGLAGFAAADVLLDGGNEVLILEKMPHMGGNSILAGGGYASWDSSLKLREALGLGEDSAELQYEDMIRGGGRTNIRELARAVCEKAPEGLDWLIARGIRFKRMLAKLGCYSVPRSYHMSMSGKEVMECLSGSICSRGAQLLLEHEVTCLYRDGPDGKMAGVRVNTPNGPQDIRVRKGIVIASGGFGNDLAFRMLYRPDLNEQYRCSNHKGATGEMIRYAQAVGADTLHMAYVQLFPCANPKTGMIDRFSFHSYSAPGCGAVYVNKKGERFVNELSGRDTVSDAQIRNGEAPTYCILNDEILQRLQAGETELENAKKNGRIFFGGSLAELEEKMGLPEGKLQQTIREHNEAVRVQNDPLFGKQMDPSMVIFDPEKTVYAAPQWPSVHYTEGGIRINAKAEVVDVLGNVIPGLYAAGEVCGGTHGSNRLGGYALAECVVFGRIAGEEINRRG